MKKSSVFLKLYQIKPVLFAKYVTVPIERKQVFLTSLPVFFFIYGLFEKIGAQELYIAQSTSSFFCKLIVKYENH